jgi:hypothetical protein
VYAPDRAATTSSGGLSPPTSWEGWGSSPGLHTLRLLITPTTAMAHIAIQEHHDGKTADWMGPVSDEQHKA